MEYRYSGKIYVRPCSRGISLEKWKAVQLEDILEVGEHNVDIVIKDRDPDSCEVTVKDGQLRLLIDRLESAAVGMGALIGWIEETGVCGDEHVGVLANSIKTTILDTKGELNGLDIG